MIKVKMTYWKLCETKVKTGHAAFIFHIRYAILYYIASYSYFL